MKKLMTLLCFALMAVVMVCGLFAGGSRDAGPVGGNAPNSSNFNRNTLARTRAPAGYTITILTVSHSGDIIPNDHPAIRALEQHTGYNIRLEYILNANYNESMNTRLAARDLPGIVVVTGNTDPIVLSATYGAFWDITDVYEQYPNLARANKDVMNNISISGRYFGFYRERDVGRAGMVYRSDWLRNVGLNEPRTLDELYNVLRAFTNNDPDGNGRPDTFGMTWTGAHMGPFHDLAVMHGAPNRFGVRNGQLTPWFEYPEFIQAMEYSKRLYDEGLINRDFAALPTGEWALPIGSNRAGWHMDVADEANRTANRLLQAGFMTQAEFDAGQRVWVMGSVANNSGQLYSRANNAGHQGYVAISTTGARTLQDLHYHLDFLDKLNDAFGQNTLNYGAEGINWTRNADSTLRVIPAAEVQGGWSVVEGLNQFRMFTDRASAVSPTAYQRRHIEVYAENLEVIVHDPTTPIASLSPTWTQRASTLNRLIDDAVINFIMGNIDRAGFQREVDRWYAEDGRTALNELQAAYARTR